MTNPPPTLFIAGLGRCGTTMVMRMLDHGGFSVAGPRPSYEVDQMGIHRDNTLYVSEQAGRAVKWIDPLNARIHFDRLASKPIFLLLKRDPEHQARSMIKMVGQKSTKQAVAAVAASVKCDQRATEAYLESAGEVFSASFEWGLQSPLDLALKLDTIVRTFFGKRLDIKAAAGAVIRRRPYCSPDLSLEAALLKDATNGR